MTRGVQNLPLLAIWLGGPEKKFLLGGPEKKFLKNLIINYVI
jgi:hypothetical protein